MFDFLVYYGIAMLVAMAFGIALAVFKHRDVSAWAFISFVFPPAVVLLFFLPNVAGAPRRPRKATWDERDSGEQRREYGDNS